MLAGREVGGRSRYAFGFALAFGLTFALGFTLAFAGRLLFTGAFTLAFVLLFAGAFTFGLALEFAGRLLFTGAFPFAFALLFTGAFALGGRLLFGCMPLFPCWTFPGWTFPGWGVVATLAGGAIRTGATLVWGCSDCNWRTCAFEMGRPSLALIASWRCANGSGAGGGGVFATTARAWIAAGG